MSAEQVQRSPYIEAIKAWLDLGVSAELADSERRRQYIINATPTIVALALLLNSFVFWAVGNMTLFRSTIYELPAVLAAALWFRWRQHQKRSASFWAACAVCQYSVVCAILTGHGTLINTHFYFLAFSITTPLIIPITNRKGLGIVSFECIVIYLALEYFQWPAAPELQQMPAHILKPLEIAVTVICSAILFMAFIMSESFSNELESKLRMFASSDTLTGLANRRTFESAIARAISHARRKESDLCLAFLDVDHFKKVNDTYGHDAGDELLKQLALILAESARGADLVARYGGEEFVVLMQECDVNGAKVACERIRAQVEVAEVQSASFKLKATVSIGVVAFMPHMNETTLIQIADQTLYLAKKQGRNRVVVYQE